MLITFNAKEKEPNISLNGKYSALKNTLTKFKYFFL